MEQPHANPSRPASTTNQPGLLRLLQFLSELPHTPSPLFAFAGSDARQWPGDLAPSFAASSSTTALRCSSVPADVLNQPAVYLVNVCGSAENKYPDWHRRDAEEVPNLRLQRVSLLSKRSKETTPSAGVGHGQEEEGPANARTRPTLPIRRQWMGTIRGGARRRCTPVPVSGNSNLSVAGSGHSCPRPRRFRHPLQMQAASSDIQSKAKEAFVVEEFVVAGKLYYPCHQGLPNLVGAPGPLLDQILSG